MTHPNFTLNDLWAAVDFKPNDAQKEAILHTTGPLYLPAGPGSGKTRVLLWRTVNLIVFQKVSPEDIYLSTFTEKAALQLQEGLRMLLGLATNHSNVQYDISKMYIGTVHSLCRRLISDRRFSPNRSRTQLPSLMDEITQYFHWPGGAAGEISPTRPALVMTACRKSMNFSASRHNPNSRPCKM
jgi:DNA helicase-2/ATP-dependent DNA helicase PcrA